MPFETKTLQKFFKSFDAQRSDRFLVTIDPKDTLEPRFQEQVSDLNSEGAGWIHCPKIEKYQVLNITVPTFEFQKETISDGILKKTFPVLKFEGFAFPILFQEDRYGTIARFVSWCQKRIVHSSGQYYHPDVSKVGDVIVEVMDWKNEPIVRYILENAYFQGQTAITLDVTNGVPLPMSINFGADYLKMETVYSSESF